MVDLCCHDNNLADLAFKRNTAKTNNNLALPTSTPCETISTKLDNYIIYKYISCISSQFLFWKDMHLFEHDRNVSDETLNP